MVGSLCSAHAALVPRVLFSKVLSAVKVLEDADYLVKCALEE